MLGGVSVFHSLCSVFWRFGFKHAMPHAFVKVLMHCTIDSARLRCLLCYGICGLQILATTVLRNGFMILLYKSDIHLYGLTTILQSTVRNNQDNNYSNFFLKECLGMWFNQGFESTVHRIRILKSQSALFQKKLQLFFAAWSLFQSKDGYFSMCLGLAHNVIAFVFSSSLQLLQPFWSHRSTSRNLTPQAAFGSLEATFCGCWPDALLWEYPECLILRRNTKVFFWNVD